jgi:uncharacterized YigZ family protein
VKNVKTVKNEIKNIYEIEKSKFITVIIPLDNKDLVQDKINELKSVWKDATHYCYAYIINDFKKSSDDGEPGGTAGVPMMEVLNQNELYNVLAVTIRYFGGIKLGAGGLVRAYRKSITECLTNNKDEIIEITKGYLIRLETTYENQKEIEYIFKRIKNKSYTDKVIYELELSIEEYEELKNKYKLEIIDNKYIEK